MGEERRTPFEATGRALGAQFTSVRGSIVPQGFGDVEAECRAVRETAGVMDRNDRAYLTASGPDAADFLHRMVTNEVKGLAPGQGCYAAQLTVQGHMIADFYLLRMPDHLLLETDWSVKDRLREVLDKHIIADDVELADRSDQLAALSVEGPAAGKLLTAAGAVTLPGQEFNHTWVELGGKPVLLARLSETGEEGYRLIFVVEYAQNLWEALTAQQKLVPWKPVGHAALNILRTEAGIPWFGVDMDEHTLPPEAGLDQRAISYQKGCYLGQEIIERIRSRGHVNRRLAGLYLGGDTLPAAGTKLLSNGKEVGQITTAVLSPALGRPLALAYVRREHLAPGTRLRLETGQGAEIAPLPFYHSAN